MSQCPAGAWAWEIESEAGLGMCVVVSGGPAACAKPCGGRPAGRVSLVWSSSRDDCDCVNGHDWQIDCGTLTCGESACTVDDGNDVSGRVERQVTLQGSKRRATHHNNNSSTIAHVQGADPESMSRWSGQLLFPSGG